MKKRISYLLLFIATVIWGFAFVAQKAAVILPAFTVGALRSGFAVLFLIFLIPLTDRLAKNGRGMINERHLPDINRAELIGGGVLGVILSVATALQQTGLENTDAGKAAFITALYVVIVPIIAAILGKRPGITVIISVPISVIGFYLLCIKSGMVINSSDLLVLLCAFVFACHITAVDRLSGGCDGVRMSLVQFAVSFVINTVVALIFEGLPDADSIFSALPSLLFLGIGSSGIAYTLQILGQKDTDPAVASIILSLESVFGVIGGAMILGEIMTEREYIGCAMVFIAVLIAQIDPDSLKSQLKIRKKDNNS